MSLPRAHARWLASVLVAAVALGACGKATPPAATVDGERVTDQQLASDMKLFGFLTDLQSATCGTKVPGETQESACARFTLENVIQEDVVKHYASAHAVTVAESSVTSTVGQIESTLGGADKLDAKLKAHGLTRDDLTAVLRRLLLFSEVQKVVAAEQLTDTALRTLYDQQQATFTMIHAKHILVATQAEANRIERQVTPKNFGELAQKFSSDGSAANGGDFGTLPASQLDQAFVAGALALKPGQISPPVHSQFGWHIIELVDVTVTPFEQAKPQLVAAQTPQIFNAWLKDALANADITVNPRYGRLDVSTGKVVPIRSTGTGSQTPSPTGAASATTSP